MNVPIRSEHIQARMQEIRSYVARIQHYTAVPDEEFFADERNVYTVEHLLLRCIESAASICSHIMARLAHTAPSSYADCFQTMAEKGILDPDLAHHLTRAARFRNILVHRYWHLDDREVLAIARQHTKDFLKFVEQVGSWLQHRSS